MAVVIFGFADAQYVRYGLKSGTDFASTKFTHANVSGTRTKTRFYIGGFDDRKSPGNFILDLKCCMFPLNT